MNFWSIILMLQQCITITTIPAKIQAPDTIYSTTTQQVSNKAKIASFTPEAMACTIQQPVAGTAIYLITLTNVLPTDAPAQVTIFNDRQQVVRMLPFTTSTLTAGQTIRLCTLPAGKYSVQIAAGGTTTTGIPFFIAHN
jgi:hypothetical protein